MNNAHIDLIWKNYPSDESPVDEENLNRMVNSINLTDENTHELDEKKASKEELIEHTSELFKNVQYNKKNGILTFTRKNGETITIDTPLEKVALDIYYDPVTEMLALPLEGGGRFEVDLSRLITELEFLSSDTIATSVEDGKVKAIVKEGSIQEKHLRPDYLAEIKIEVAKAESSAGAAGEKAKEASSSALLAKSYNSGNTGMREGEDTDNAKYYSEQAKEALESLEQAGVVTGVKGSAETAYRMGNVNMTAGNVGALSIPTSLKGSLGDYKTPGFYYAVGGNKITEKPQGVDSFGLLVTREGNLNRGQFLFSSRKGIGIYIRRWDSDSNVWTEWVQVIDSGGNAVSATKVMQLVTNNVLARPVLFSDTNENASGVSSVCKDLNFHYVPLNGVLEVPYLYSNTRDSTVSYTSNDNTNPTAWTNISAITSGEKHSSLFNKISTMFKNVRYIYKMLGTTDISQLGDGTVTGALSSLNANSLKCKVVSASIAGIAAGAYKIIELGLGLTGTNTLSAVIPYLQHHSYQQMEVKLISATANSVTFRVNNNSNAATSDGVLHIAILYK